MEVIILVVLFILFFILISRYQKKTLRIQDDIERKIFQFDTHLLESLQNMEKKICEHRHDVETVRKDFKRFQAKFLEFDRKINKITSGIL